MRMTSIFAAFAFAIALLAAPFSAAYADFNEQQAASSGSTAGDPLTGTYDSGPSCAPGSGPSAICAGD